MKYSFKTHSDRENSKAEKYTLREELFGTKDVLPAWVADMNIDTPYFVLEAVKKRLEHSIIGYQSMPDSAFEAQIEWMKSEHGISYALEDLLYSHSVVASMDLAIDAFSDVGDKVIVQTPIYPPFLASLKEQKREVLNNPLVQGSDGKYSFDIEDLRSKIDERTKLLLLCSPHNPVGRAWRREELEEILELCLEHNIVVFSDEIHSDLVYAPNKHIPFASLSQKARDITITAIGVGKTFNMAGFAMSSVAIANKDLKERFLKSYHRVHIGQGSVLSQVAFETAYREGKEWLGELKVHLWGNYELLVEVCKKHKNIIKVIPIEATYLAWLDCRGLGLSNRKIKEFFVKEAKLGLNTGLSFSKEGSGFMRLNFGVSRDEMQEIVKRLDGALLKFSNE
ncbi:MAG: PatB family C-S lyase [Sulfurimonas sp.]|uniref:PatB family C-S lyase n=1 Tax=Sulfurimonas sp. TaxID=2022749 RepID=UPI0025CEB4A6|nr:PatB family C-S lyase [Sulfurimonas sp.]MCK9491665.1 PatB family C-S lyase [Sulfurimonas sp.]